MTSVSSLAHVKDVQQVAQETWNSYTDLMFARMGVLKDLNPGDSYLESYKWHFNKHRDKFFDHYHLAYWYGVNNPRKRCLEIGTRTGLSTVMLLDAHQKSKRPEKVICVDPWSDGYANPGIVKMNLNELKIPYDNVEFVKAKSEDIFRIWETQKPEPFDWILIDGDHTPEVAAEDLRQAVKHLASGGILIFDDISVDGCNLEPVWDEFVENCGVPGSSHKNLNGKGTAWLLKN